MCEHDHRGDRDASGLFAGPVLALDLLNNFSWRGRAFRAGWLSRQDGLLRGLSATGLGRRRAPGSASLPGTRHGRHWSGYSQVETCSEQHEAARPQRCKRFGGRGRIASPLSKSNRRPLGLVRRAHRSAQTYLLCISTNRVSSWLCRRQLRTEHSCLLGSPLALGQRRRLSPLVRSVPPESSHGASFTFPPACSTRATQATGALHEVGSHLILTALLAGRIRRIPDDSRK
jgi:hypothetical protein